MKLPTFYIVTEKQSKARERWTLLLSPSQCMCEKRAVPSFKRQGLFFVLCHGVCTGSFLWKVSMWLKSSHSALRLHPLQFISGQADGTPLDQGIQTKTGQMKETKNKTTKKHGFLRSIKFKIHDPQMPLYFPNIWLGVRYRHCISLGGGILLLLASVDAFSKCAIIL